MYTNEKLWIKMFGILELKMSFRQILIKKNLTHKKLHLQ